MTESTTATPPASLAARMGSRRLFARLRDRIVASDPAYSRLRMASRAILSVILTGAALAGLTAFRALPLAAYGLAVVIAFIGSMAIRDSTPRGQIVTRAFGGGVCIAAVLLASVLAPFPTIADLAFLAVIFAAVYARKAGPRGFALGMLAFMAYFMGDYLHPDPRAIGWVALAAAIALVVTHLVVNVILVDIPERDFRRALTTIDLRIRLILLSLGEAAAAGVLDKDHRKDLNGQLIRLHDIMLMAEGFIPQGDGGALTAHGAASELAIALFDLQLAVERLVAASFRALPPPTLLDAVLHDNEAAIAAAADALHNMPEDNDRATRQVLMRMHRARQRLAAALGPEPSPAFKPVEQEGAQSERPDKSDDQSGKPAKDGEKGLVPASLHLPIQVTLASAIAMAAGLLTSSTRWYWAVITAFIVFNNTRSRADTAVKALQRSAGTLAGLVAGTVVATLMQGQTVASAIAILALFFVGFYFVQTSYGVMIFFITIAIALLYGLMGVFTPQLLVLRLEETVIGALAGVLVAFFVFPQRARTSVDKALDAYLTALKDVVAATGDKAAGSSGSGDLLALSRALDRAYADLAAAARPLGGPWTVVTRFGEVREKLLLLLGCVHWSRALAHGLSRGGTLSPEETARIRELSSDVVRQIDRAQTTRRRFFAKSDPHAAMPKEPRRTLAVREDESPVLALEMIQALVDRAMSGALRRKGVQAEP